jgi:hypothetical protein
MYKTIFQNSRDTKTRGEISDQRFKEIGLKPDTLKTIAKTYRAIASTRIGASAHFRSNINNVCYQYL